jgi:DNA-binding MarR family transcriptional regulator
MKNPHIAPLRSTPDAPAASLRSGRFSVWLSQISRALAQQMLVYSRRELGLNLAEYRALSVLFESSSASIREIAAGTNLDKAQVIRAVGSLTRRGLAIQSIDRRDRRLRVVKLTAAGRAVIAKSLPFVVERQQRMDRALAPNELRALWRALAVLDRETRNMLAEEIQRPAKPKRGRPKAGP